VFDTIRIMEGKSQGAAAGNGNPYDEAEAIRRFQAGDEAAARALFQRHAPGLRAHALRKMPAHLAHKFDSSDVLQETYLVAFQKVEEFEASDGAAFFAWLRTILEFKVREFIRHHLGTAKRDAARERKIDPVALDVACPELTPASRAISTEERAALWHMIEELPEDYRSVLRMVHERHLTLAEIAQRMRRSPEAVRKLYGRAVAKLAERIPGGGASG
jgi:RNA polymerase sigma-70 factor (ECF subfamily)